jgi:signal transduction histidine kinase
MSAVPMARILIVDDEAAQVKALCDTLAIEGFAIVGLASAKRALNVLREQEFDLLLTDLMMPEMDGIALVAAARKISPDIVAVVMTGHATIDTAVRAMQAGALDYIVKPFKLHVIRPVLDRALAMRRLRVQNRQLEEHVRERTRELEVANRELQTANRELESFSYSVSHDLRAPLSAVQGFCHLYMEEFNSTIPPQGLPLLEQVEAGARRMAQLIQDLLSLAQLGRQQLVKATVALGPLVQRVRNELTQKAPDRSVEFRIGDLGECECDASLIEQVLINLLSNALKFTRRRDPAIIQVDCRRNDDVTIYSVRDNGVGFSMDGAEKLFGAFERLHAASEYEGTGVGLSIVQRIIERHGGRIWAESEPGKGAAFHFTLAAASRKSRRTDEGSAGRNDEPPNG